MPGFGLRKFFKKKSAGAEQIEPATLPKKERENDQSMMYIRTPSALEYPGMKSVPEKEEASKPGKEKVAPGIKAEQKKKKEENLPRCPKCGWAIGFEDNACTNCGEVVRPKA